MDKLIKNGKKIIKLAQNNLEFYPYDKDNNVVNVNGKNYQNIQKNSDGSISIDNNNYVEDLIGEEINIPENTVYPKSFYANDDDSLGVDSEVNPNFDEITGTIIGVFQARGSIYITTGSHITGYNGRMAWFNLDQVEQYIQNGGVTRPLLTHVRRALARFVTSEMEVA